MKRHFSLHGGKGAFSGFREDEDPGGCSASWHGHAEHPEGHVETRYRLLGWRDIGRMEFRRSLFQTLLGAFRTFHAFAKGGGYAAAWRPNKPHALFCVYPPLMLFLYCLSVFVLPVMLAALLGLALMTNLDVAWPFAFVGSAALAFLHGFLAHWLFQKAERFTYFFYLLHDWHSFYRLATDQSPELDARIKQFAEEIRREIEALPRDEDVLIMAHSSGTFVLAFVLGEILRQDPDFGRDRGKVQVLSYGSAFGYLAGFPVRPEYGQAIEAIGAAPGLDWSDVYCPHDFMCCGRQNIVERFAPEGSLSRGAKEPRRFSARMPDRFTAEQLAHLRFRLFARHFCYHMASIRNDIFDLYRLTLGPLPVTQQMKIWAGEVEPEGTAP